MALVEAILAAIQNRPIREQGNPAAAHRVQQGRLTNYIEIGLLLPGKGGVGQILRRGAGTHRIGVILAHVLPRPAHRLDNLRRNGHIHQGAAHLLPNATGGPHILSSHGIQQCIEIVGHWTGMHKLCKCPGRHAETRGHREASMGHFTQVGPFSTHQGQICGADLCKRQDEGIIVYHNNPETPRRMKIRPKARGAQMPMARLWVSRPCLKRLSRSWAWAGNET